MLAVLLSLAFAGGSWTDDFSDNDISDWTVLDGSWTAVGGGVVQGYSDSHTGPDFIIDPGMDDGVTQYTVTARMRSDQTMGLTLDYGNSSLNCGYFHWAGSATYKTNPTTIESNIATVSWSNDGSTWYELKAEVDKSAETVDIYLDGSSIYSGDICDGYLNDYTATGEIGFGLHSGSSYTTQVDWIEVEWEYVDNDGDGYTEDDNDCDDDDNSVNPSASEVWYDGIDQDCDGGSDYDADGDSYDSDSYGGTDCDDSEASIYLGAPDTWYDGVDSDCGLDSDYDADGDTYDSDDYGGGDCDDTVSSVNPGASEIGRASCRERV